LYFKKTINLIKTLKEDISGKCLKIKNDISNEQSPDEVNK